MLIIFPSLSSPCFHLFSLKVGRRNGRVCIWAGGGGAERVGVKLRVPLAHPSPLIAQDVFGFAQIRPEHTPSRIQLNCSRAHIGCSGPRSAWMGPSRHDGEFHPNLTKPTQPPTSVLLKIPQCSCQGGVKGAKDLGLQMFQQVKDKRWEEGH